MVNTPLDNRELPVLLWQIFHNSGNSIPVIRMLSEQD
jgi:hypothetical protein